MNLYKRLVNLLPQRPLQIGTVLFIEDGVATIETLGGGESTARGEAQVGTKVFFRDGAIEGPAPDLPVDNIEV